MGLICPESVTCWDILGRPTKLSYQQGHIFGICLNILKNFFSGDFQTQKTGPIFQPFSREKTCNWRLLKVMHHSLNNRRK